MPTSQTCDTFLLSCNKLKFRTLKKSLKTSIVLGEDEIRIVENDYVCHVISMG